MKKFGNTANKINAIKSVFADDEKLTGKQICERVRALGYNVQDNNFKMFIYYNMLHQHLVKQSIRGCNHYKLMV